MTQGIDLYQIDLDRISGEQLYAAVREFAGLDREMEQRPSEGYLLDFKSDWSDSILKTAAAFANTFGGLILVGVSDVDGRPSAIDGIQEAGELKTRMASFLASNITPCPHFEIADCRIPNEPTKQLALVRIHQSDTVHLVTKRIGSNPVYVRIEDKSEPADAFRLRQLIERPRKVPSEVGAFRQILSWWNSQLYVTTKSEERRARTPRGLKIVLSPSITKNIDLDSNVERGFVKDVLTIFKLGDPPIGFDHNMTRGLDWFEVSLLDVARDYERRWRMTSRAEIGFATQVAWPVMKSNGQIVLAWSLFDLIADVMYLIQLAQVFWQGHNYYGSATISLSLNVVELPLDFEEEGFPPRFHESRTMTFPFQRSLLAIHPNPKEEATIEARIEYSSLIGAPGQVGASLVNMILRSLGHLVPDIESLRTAAAAFA